MPHHTPLILPLLKTTFLPFSILGPENSWKAVSGISPNDSEEGMLATDRLELEEGPAPPHTAQCECGTYERWAHLCEECLRARTEWAPRAPRSTGCL